MPIHEATSNILKQIIELIESIGVENYSKPVMLFNDATMGQHFRHIHDFYACLLIGCNCDTVDYSDRKRRNELEQDPVSIISELRKIIVELVQLDTDKELSIYGDVDSDSINKVLIKSSVGRELMYAYDHAIHHLAIVKLGIRAEFPEIAIDNNLGVSPSTIKHQQHSHTKL